MVLKKVTSGIFSRARFQHPAKRWLLSFSSPPLGEITEREAGCENPFFNTLLMVQLVNEGFCLPQRERIESFCKPVVDLGQHYMRFGFATL
jgi:hypothetical protein